MNSKPPAAQASTAASKGYLIALNATLLWSFTGILISYLSVNYKIPSLVLAFWRDTFVSSGLVVGFLIIRPALFRLSRSLWGFMLLYGLSLALFNTMWTFSVEYNGAAIATVLAFISPAITAMLERWLLNERINRLKLISILLAIPGTILVSGAHDPAAWRLNAPGIIFGLLTGLLFAIYNLMGKTAANKSIHSWTGLFYSFSIAAAFLFCFNLLFNTLTGDAPTANFFWLGDSLSGWLVLLFLGIGPTLGGFGLYTMSLGYLPATVASLIATLEPALTAIWAYFLLGEQLNGNQLSGSVLILTGVILLRIGEKSHRAKRPMKL